MGNSTNDAAGLPSDGERMLPVVGDDDAGVSGDVTPEATVACSYTTGIAGSGKTHLWRERIAADPSAGLLMATTGIAAVNLGTVTLNSSLRFFDTASLRDAYLNGALVRRLKELREDYRTLVIDEVSMMDGDQLGILVRAALECNSWLSPTHAPALGLTVVGDFCQLPPVKAKWAFESDEWQRFHSNTTRLTTQYRQSSGAFLNALNFTRSGDGATAADILSSEGLEWHPALDTSFDGTTIVPKNDMVDRYNALALDRLPSQAFTLTNRRWGRQRGEWKQVPDRVTLKPGAYVMLLANAYDEERNLVYANGDCGHVEEPLTPHGTLHVRLVRNDAVVSVSRVIRDLGTKDKPEGWGRDGVTGHGEWLALPHWMPNKRRFVEGQCQMWPVRLAYASTVHKSQGLSLDKLQCDIRDHFFSSYGMIYVALSRVRQLSGLRIVGQKERFISQCKCDPRVAPWL
jgi:ATP-dependent DNA helicase PIF1